MKIGTRLVLRFALIVSSILLCFSFSIYYFTSKNRENIFYTRLHNRAITSAKLLIQVKEIDDKLLQIINKNTVNALSGERLAIYNYLNKNIYHYEKDLPPILVSEDILNKIRLEKEYRFKINDQEALGFVYEEKNSHFLIIAAAADNLGNTQINYLKWLLTIGFIISLLIIVFSGWVFVKQMLKPLSEIIGRVSKITASNLSLRLNEGNKNDELGHLSITFNNMLERLESAFSMQKRFVSNASHELRTPLTAITGQIEVTLMKQRNEVEYQNILLSILDDTKNLSRLTNGLLELAQVDSESLSLKFQSLRIDELLWETREELLKRNKEYNINIEFETSQENEDKLIIEGNKPLLKTAFGNLMDNGCKFSFDKKIRVTINTSELLILNFEDKGRGIPSNDLGKIFQPFYRSEKTRNIPGYGLGLSLSEKIITLHKGKIKIESQPGKGTKVEVIF